MKDKGFGTLKTRLFAIKTSQDVGLRGPWNISKTSYDIRMGLEKSKKKNSLEA